MRKLVTGRRMKEIDAYTIKDIGIPSMVLMEKQPENARQSVKRRSAVRQKKRQRKAV